MHKKLIFILLILVGCSAQPSANPTLDPIVIEAAVQATLDSQANMPPTLLAPADGEIFEASPVTLEWEWIRPLYGEETYDVQKHKGMERSNVDR